MGNEVEYHLYEVVQQTGIRSESGEEVGTLEVGEQVYARADTLKSTTTDYHPEILYYKEIDTEIQHERGWSRVKFATNDPDDGYQQNSFLKLVDTVIGSPDEYPSLP